MNLYLAPMEGITGYLFRNVQHRYFHGIDKYITPFITPTQNRKLTSRELNDILPEHNQGMHVVPQILTNQAEGFLWAAEKAKALGYEEVNLNLGCPSGTVVKKGRGAGFLADPWKLDRFLDEVSRGLGRMEMKLSVKTRIGDTRPEEFEELMEVYNRYVLSELIIHPRVRTDYYKNSPNREVFCDALAISRNPVCYNGDLFNIEDYRRFVEEMPEVTSVMLGRGMVANPGLAAEIVYGEPLSKEKLYQFHDTLLSEYRQVISGDRNVLFKMKELWFYLGGSFQNSEKAVKRIKKAAGMEAYEAAVAALFMELPLAEHPGYSGRESR